MSWCNYRKGGISPTISRINDGVKLLNQNGSFQLFQLPSICYKPKVNLEHVAAFEGSIFFILCKQPLLRHIDLDTKISLLNQELHFRKFVYMPLLSNCIAIVLQSLTASLHKE